MSNLPTLFMSGLATPRAAARPPIDEADRTRREIKQEMTAARAADTAGDLGDKGAT